MSSLNSEGISPRPDCVPTDDGRAAGSEDDVVPVVADRAPAPAPRIQWVDAAKGVAITLVVLYHSTLFLDDVGLASRWTALNPLLDTFRMPLFFFLAGVFAAKTLRRPFAAMFRRRAWPLLWTYALWCVVYVAATQVIPWSWTDRTRPAWSDLWSSLWVPNSSLWFLYALFLYSITGWLMVRLPVWAQLVPTAVLSALVGSDVLTTHNTAGDKIAVYYFFFLLAVHYGDRISRPAPVSRFWVLAPVFAASSAAIIALDLESIPGLRLVVSVLAVRVGVLLGQRLVAVGKLGTWASRLGHRTLPVYVLHYYPIFLAAALLSSAPSAAHAAAAALPPTLAAVAIAFALVVHRVLAGVPWLWTAPRWSARRYSAR